MRGHICLVGSALCRNWHLVQRLAGRHGLTLLNGFEQSDVRFLAVVDLVALDCRERGAAGSRELVDVLRQTTDVPIVVLDGGLRPSEVATLLSAGAHDYFPEPFNVALIAERLEHLADSSRSQRIARFARDPD